MLCVFPSLSQGCEILTQNVKCPNQLLCPFVVHFKRAIYGQRQVAHVQGHGCFLPANLTVSLCEWTWCYIDDGGTSKVPCPRLRPEAMSRTGRSAQLGAE